MDFIEKEGLSEIEAVFSAARALGIDEKDAQVQVLSGPGARRVKVRVGKPGIVMPPIGAPQAEEAQASGGSAPREESSREQRPPRQDYAPQVAAIRTPPTAEQMGRAQADLERLLTAMGAPGQVESKERAGNKILNIIAPAHESLLIGRRGQTAEALQVLINEFMGRREGDASLYLVVDVADYHGRSEERLVEKAKTLAAQVIADGGEQSMGQLSPPERRIVHMTLKEMGGVESFSVGQGSVKKLVIKKA